MGDNYYYAALIIMTAILLPLLTRLIMQIDKHFLRLAQAQARIAISQRCDDVWWLAMEFLKASYGRSK